MKLYFVTAIIWIRTVTATLESDSHGNWSNEKNETYTNSQLQSTKQIVQPYVLPTEGTPSQEFMLQGSSTTLKHISTPENASNDLNHAVSKEHIDIENVGDFGQRVRPSSLSRHRSNDNFGRIRSRQGLDILPVSEDSKKQHRKNSRLFVPKKLNVTNNTINSSAKLYATPEDQLTPAPTKSTESQKTSKQKYSEEEYPSDYFQNNKVNLQNIPGTNEEEIQQSAKREYKPRKQLSEQEKASTSKDTSSSTSTSVPIVSLGKFSGPIVVPDLLYPNQYSHTVAADHFENTEVSKPIPAWLETTTKLQVSDTGYLAPSPVVLSPLQVGIALMNAGQDVNSVNDPITPVKDYLQEEIDISPATVSDNRDTIQTDGANSENSSYNSDQVTQQEQISEVVESNSPSHSVEIQKSVEIFHTAPVHEIHYPVEFVPYIQSPLIKQRPQETDFRKSNKGSKDRRPVPVNIYKSNEIVDEIVPSNSRYEYNVNDNDVVYSATNGQDQISATARPIDGKSVFGAREQLSNAPFNQIVIKNSRVQGNMDAIPKDTVRNDFDLAKGPSAAVTQPTRVLEGLSDEVNLENRQGNQEASQILLTKASNEPQTELRLLMSVPQPYPVEKVIEKSVHVPHTADVVDKKLLYPVEKVIEKQITIPQPFPVHVPIDRIVEKQIRIPYPVHVEKVIEKKVPFAIQRLIIPFPIHFRVPQPIPIPVEKIIEKPVPVPVPVEKIVEKAMHVPRPYPLEVEKSIERRPYTLESQKILKSVAIPIYNVQNDRNFQQVIRPQSYQTSSGPSYGSAGNDQEHFNLTQFYSLDYVPSGRPHARQPLVHVIPMKYGSYGIQYPHVVDAYSALNGNNGNSLSYGKTPVEQDKVKDKYVGPVPRQGNPLGLQTKILQYASPDTQSTLRRTRQEVSLGNTGSFRQSKMEYGFKPPMVPSVQYDEQTATKVE